MASYLFLIPFVAGLGLGVFAMLGGIEARKSVLAAIDRFGREPVLGRIRANVPVVAGALGAFGGLGYLASRFWGLTPWRATGVGLGAALVVSVAVTLLIRRWAVPFALREPADPRFVLQGQVAQVQQAIRRGETGTVVYELNGRTVHADARSVDGSPISPDSEVVIERVENDIVYVEAWSVIEQRI